MGYTWKDLAYWGGLITGLSATYVTLQNVFGMGNGILLFLLSLGVGVVCGIVGEQLYLRSRAATAPPPNMDAYYDDEEAPYEEPTPDEAFQYHDELPTLSDDRDR